MTTTQTEDKSGAKHTPGPWTNREHSTFVWSKDGNVCACGDPRALATVGYTKCDIGTPALSEAVANARLIAATPTMATYIEQRAQAGDKEAQTIMEAIRGHS